MKRLLSLLLCAALLILGAPALAEISTDSAAYGVMYVNGITSDRVNLRSQAEQNSTSMGLFFTGTTVNLLSDPSQTWVHVYIGTQVGYMLSKYLTYDAVASKQPVTTVKNVNSTYANMRDEPSENAGLRAALNNGERVTVLGETDSRWYYVDWNGTLGYIRSDLLALGGSSSGTAASGTAYVNGGTSDRVHLRTAASRNGSSMGLFFTGTKVSVLTSLRQNWVKVQIGTQTGYMQSAYLTQNAVTSKQPVGTVNNAGGTYANLRSTPSEQSSLLSRLNNGTALTVLGETHSGWYCVDRNDAYAYIRADLLSLGGTPASTTMTIRAPSSDRVHLRASASAKGASMGLYFTGTTVTVLSGGNSDWVHVQIGSQTGYMDADCLTRNAVTSLQPVGTVSNAYVNLRSDATERSSRLAQLPRGETVIVLGETHSKWYYVDWNGMLGYIREDLLNLDDNSAGSIAKLA